MLRWEQRATHNPHPDHRTHYYKSVSHHLSSLLQQVPTHPNAQLSESDVREFPALPRATHHSSPHDLASEPKFHANLLLQLYLTSKFTNSLHYTLSCTVIFAYSKVSINHSIHPHSIVN